MTVQKKDTNTHIHKNNNNYNDQTIYETENSFGEQKNRVTAAVDVLDELKPRTSRLGGQTLFCFFFCFFFKLLFCCFVCLAEGDQTFGQQPSPFLLMLFFLLFLFFF